MAAATIAMALTLPALAACNSGAKDGAAADPCVSTTSKPTMKIALDTIHANIWNAAGKAGEAASVAAQLKWRGVHVIDTGNDPQGGQPPKHAEIRYGANGKQIALTLAQQIKDAKLVQDDRTNPSVDLVIGTSFALMPVPPPAPAKITVNVYNAYVLPGTAASLATDLRKRGFKVHHVGNDPDGGYFPHHAVAIRYGLQGEPAARRAALQFHDVQMVDDHRKSATVDVVIGSKWKDSAIVPVAKATVPPTTPARKSPKCTVTASTRPTTSS